MTYTYYSLLKGPKWQTQVTGQMICMKESRNINDAGIYPQLVIQHQAIDKTRKIQWLTSVHLILSYFSLSRKGSMCHYSSQQLTITQRLRIIKLWMQHGIRKVVFSIIQRNWFVKYLKSQNRCIVKLYSLDKHIRLGNLVLGPLKILIKPDDSKVMFLLTKFIHKISWF